MRRTTVVTKPQANINVTSLLDITFVLLIAFMIVAPNLRHGVDLELPEVREAPVMEETKTITLSVRPGLPGPEVYVNGRLVDLEDLVAAVERERGTSEVSAITVEGDRETNWEQMLEVISTLKGAGIEEFGIVTEVRRETGSRRSRA